VSTPVWSAFSSRGLISRLCGFRPKRMDERTRAGPDSRSAGNASGEWSFFVELCKSCLVF
jgi:hypothetical protein